MSIMYIKPQQPHGEGITVGFGFLAVIMGVLGIFSLFSNINLYLVNIPYSTLLGFQAWRIFTALVAMPNILTMIFTVIMLFLMSYDEFRVGSSRFILTIFFRNIAIQIGVALIGLFLQLLTGLPVSSSGIWPVFITSITLSSLQNPEGETNLLLSSCPIKSKYYPLIILAFFMVITSFVGLPLDVILGYLFGVWMHQNPKVRQTVDPSHRTVVWFEDFLRNFEGMLGPLIGVNETGYMDDGVRNWSTQPPLTTGFQQYPQFIYPGQGFSPQSQGYAIPNQGHPFQGQNPNFSRPGGYTGIEVPTQGTKMPPTRHQPFMQTRPSDR